MQESCTTQGPLATRAPTSEELRVQQEFFYQPLFGGLSEEEGIQLATPVQTSRSLSQLLCGSFASAQYDALEDCYSKTDMIVFYSILVG